MVVGHTGSMPGLPRRVFVDPVRRTGAVVLRQRHDRHAAATGCRVELLETLEARRARCRSRGRPTRDVPVAVAEILGVWHWGNTALRLRVGRQRGRGRQGRRGGVRSAPLRPQDDGTFLGTAGYHHGERLHVVRNEDGRISHLLCETFVYTRVPYDPAAPVPGGHALIARARRSPSRRDPQVSDGAESARPQVWMRSRAAHRRSFGGRRVAIPVRSPTRPGLRGAFGADSAEVFRAFAPTRRVGGSVGLGDAGHVEVGDPQGGRRGAREVVVAPLAAEKLGTVAEAWVKRRSRSTGLSLKRKLLTAPVISPSSTR